LLTWIKSWDYIVFGKERDKNAAEKKAEQNTNKKRKRVYNQTEADLEDKILELDEYNRPKIKVALISGPPGLGKSRFFLLNIRNKKNNEFSLIKTII
jgi:chromosome transmission fidelity protein 18